MALTNKDDHKDNYKKNIWRTISRKIWINKKINPWNKLTWFNILLKVNTFRKRFDGFSNGIEVFFKKNSGEMKLEEAKKLQNVLKSNLNEIWRGRYKSEKWKRALENIKLLYKSREVVIRLFNNYLSVIS